jgi:SNF2 family DNA or RNA helicase
MGVGKSPPVAVAARHMRLSKILVLCPAAVKNHWARIFADWYPDIPITIHEGYIKQVCIGVNIASHVNMVAAEAVAAIIAGSRYDLVVLDEAHEFRVYTATRCRNLFSSLEPSFIWKIAERLWALTGTPLVNSACDLWPIWNDPLSANVSWWDWGCYFAEMRPDAGTGYKAVGLRNALELAALLRPYVLRRTAASIGLKLPPLTVNSIPIKLPEGALATAMAGISNWTPQQLITALEQQDELRDAAISRVRQVLGLAKAEAAAYGVDSLLRQNAGPIVLFFQHTAVRDQLCQRLKHWRIGVIDGKTSRGKIATAESAHKAGQLDLLLVQTQAGGTGLNLVASNREVVVELPWTSTALLQAIARAHRIGQTRPVTADILRAADCWLEDVFSVVVGKKQKASDELLSLLTTNT